MFKTLQCQLEKILLTAGKDMQWGKPFEFLGINFCSKSQNQAKRIGPYLFYYKNRIAKGKFSEVYKGIDTRDNTELIIKILNLELMKQQNLMSLISQQVNILQKLDHQNIIKLYNKLISHSNCYLVLQKCQEMNLLEKIKSQGISQKIERQKIILDLFNGIQYLSQKGIIHRDLKTANIVLDKLGRAKISDFGFATQSYTQVRDIFVGTPFYMSPQSYQEQRYSPKSDVWSFGIIVYEMFYGQVPLEHCKTKDQLIQSLTQPIKLDDTIPSDVKSMLEGCFQLNPMHRSSIEQLKSSAYINKLIRKYSISVDEFGSLPISKKHQKYKTHLASENSSYVSSRISLGKSQRQANTQARLQYQNTIQAFITPIMPVVSTARKPQPAQINRLRNNSRNSSSSIRRKIQSRLSLKSANSSCSKPKLENTHKHIYSNKQNKMNNSLKSLSRIYGLRMNYRQIVSLIHYNRLIFKILSYPQCFRVQLVIFLLKIAEDLCTGVIKYDPESLSNSTQQVLEGYRNKYLTKYHRYSQMEEIPIGHLISACRSLISMPQVQRKQRKLLHCLIDDSIILEQVIRNRLPGDMAKFMKSQQVLKNYFD